MIKKREVITFKWNKSGDVRIGLFIGFSKDNKYFRIRRLNPYIGYTSIVKIPINKITIFQADNKIQVSAGKSTNNNPESKTRGENDE